MGRTGIGPETFAFLSDDGTSPGDTTPDATQAAFYDAHGFYIRDPYYVLRPEVLESNFYAWRATGDPKYLDRAASALERFRIHLQIPDASTPGRFTGLKNVDRVPVLDADRFDDMESFW